MSSTSASAKPSILAPVVVMFVVGFIAGYLVAIFMPTITGSNSAPHQVTDGRIITSSKPRDERDPVEQVGQNEQPKDEQAGEETPADAEHPQEPTKAPTH